MRNRPIGSSDDRPVPSLLMNGATTSLEPVLDLGAEARCPAAPRPTRPRNTRRPDRRAIARSASIVTGSALRPVVEQTEGSRPGIDADGVSPTRARPHARRTARAFGSASMRSTVAPSARATATRVGEQRRGRRRVRSRPARRTTTSSSARPPSARPRGSRRSRRPTRRRARRTRRGARRDSVSSARHASMNASS